MISVFLKAIFDALLDGNFVNLKRDVLETHVGTPRHRIIVFELCDTVVSFETLNLEEIFKVPHQLWHTKRY